MLQLFAGAQKAVVEIRIFGGVNPDEIALSLTFKQGLNNDISVFWAEVQELVHIFFLRQVELVHLVNLLSQIFCDFPLFFIYCSLVYHFATNFALEE